jgi:hypothetical protein
MDRAALADGADVTTLEAGAALAVVGDDPPTGPPHSGTPQGSSKNVGFVLNPTAERTGTSPDPVRDVDGAGPCLGLGTVSGRTIGVRWDNLWRSWEWVWDEWRAALEDRGAGFASWRSGTRGGPDTKRVDQELATFLGGIDIAIVGLGTCGSCTMWTVHDALAAVAQGKPTLAVVTDHFAGLARHLATREGQPDLPIYVLPYPLESRPAAEVRAIARDHLPRFLAALGLAE